jgi:WD40 repeat protein
MTRVFLSHSSRDNLQAMALKQWLAEQDPGLADEIFLDSDPGTGIAPGERWKEALRRANERCEAVICLLSAAWEASRECQAEYRTAENLGKLILGVRLEPEVDGGITREWQRCDLFGNGAATKIQVAANGKSSTVEFLTEGLQRLHRGLRKAGIGTEHFVWPPPGDPDRAPYRGWEPLEEVDAAVFFGRDGQIVRGLDELRGMRRSGLKSLFMVLGPSGTGKSSFLRAGLLPRLRRDDRQFLVMGIVRPERNVLTGDRGLAAVIHTLRTGFGLTRPTLGEIKRACTAGDAEQLQGWLDEARKLAFARLGEVVAEAPAPTLVLPLDQAEELFGADAGPEAPRFLATLTRLLQRDERGTPPLIVAGTIRADFYEKFQTAPELADLKSVVFDELKPMPVGQFREVILGPAARATDAGKRLGVEPALVDRLLEDCIQGADTLPLLALTLARLYQDYGSDGDLTLAEYQAMGGMHHVVQHEIDTLLSHDPAVRQQQVGLLHSAFIPWLATIHPDTDQPIRRIARLSDIPAESRPLIDAMVERRLLVRDERGGEPVIEVALESLLRQWVELTGWLETEREDLKEAETLERAAAAWERSHRHDSWLLEGERLDRAEPLAAKPGFRARLSPVRQFLLASRHREEASIAVRRRRARVLRTAVAATVLTAVLATAGFVQASVTRSEADARAREATALRLSAEGQAMLAGVRSGGDVRALQQMLAAHSLAVTAEGDTVLASAVTTQREVQKIWETGSPANSVAFSPDGGRIVSGGADGTVRQWHAATGLAIGEPMTGHEQQVRSAAYSPDGRRIVSGGFDGMVRLWDAETGRAVGKPMDGKDSLVNTVAFSPDGRRVISGGLGKVVRLWDADTGQAVGEPMTGHEDQIMSVAFSPDGRRIVSGGNDGTVRLWDADTHRAIGKPMSGHKGWVWSLAFSPDSGSIVSGSDDGTLRLWDARTGRAVGAPMTGHAAGLTSVAFSPDGRRIVSCGPDRTVRLWDSATGRAVGKPMIGHENWVNSVAFSPDGRRIVSSGNDGTMRLWDAMAVEPMAGHEGSATSAAFSPDGSRIVSGSGDGTVRLWDAATGRAVGEPMTGHSAGVTGVAFSRDGGRIVSGGTDRTIRLWDPTTARAVGQPMTGHGDWVSSVAFSPDGGRIVSGSGDGTVRLWDVGTGRTIGEPMTGHDLWASSVAFSPDGKRIVSGGYDGMVRVWDADTHQAVGEPLAGHNHDVKSVAFSPDGRRIVSGGNDGTVRLWDADTHQAVGEPMTGHEEWVNSVAFSPDGRRIVTGGNDGTVRLWDADTGRAIGGPMTGHDQDVMSVGFSPDGGRIVSAGNDGTLRIWPSLTSWTDTLCAKLTQNMSRQQWRDWVSSAISYIEVCSGLPIPADATAH